MYLFRLKLDPANRTTRTLYTDSYLLHQAIYKAFPEENEGGPGRILYRLDITREGKVNLIIQSEKHADWSKAQILQSCLEEPVDKPKIYPPSFSKGQKLMFLIRANPSVKKKAENRKNGYRIGILREENQLVWLNNKAEKSGFEVVACRTIPEGIVRDQKSNNGGRLSHFAVRFEGILKIINPALFTRTVEQGIGPAKGFGFGLLSVAPVKQN